jgi:NtrC-family two-component system response regulator AlgB
MDILLIDDEASLRRTLRTVLEATGHRVREATTQAEALSALERARPELVLLDLRLGRESGLDVLDALLRAAPGLGVVVITAYATVDTAVEAMKRGAFDYLPKPFTPEQLAEVINRWKDFRPLPATAAEAETAVLQSAEPVMREVLEVAFQVAPSEATVLLRGESGTGKGVLARAIHARSRRATGPFVTIHCPSLTTELLESELFGHARGAFTGAVRETAGKVAAAEGGTLFLDEVADLPLGLQPKLLRLVQEKSYERVGDARPRTADVRLLAATNRDLEAEVRAGRFREDLFYRLNVIELTVPPLRQRPADLLPLAEHLLAHFARRTGKAIDGFTPAAHAALIRHHWPGNVRELRNAIERAVLLGKGRRIDVGDLPESVTSPGPGRVGLGEGVTLEELEVEHIRRVLAASKSLDEAARKLGIDPATLYRKRKRYGL